MFKTRIAPSPTGDMHIGTARTAYFNWLAAKASGGKFVLRIDDTDQKRNDPAYVKVILDVMEWLGLDYDQIVFQGEQFGLYMVFAAELVTRKLAVEKDGAICLDISNLEAAVAHPNWNRTLPTSWKDEIGGEIAITADDVSHTNGMVLIKSDGSPSYNFCSIVDDLTMGINLVIRGTDHIPNTARQVILHHLLNVKYDGVTDRFALPKFAHVGLICVKGVPMSKRDGSSSMLKYKADGYDPDAMLNFLARMGWGPFVDDKTTALLPRERMIELFLTGGKMRSQPAGFDLAKLDSFDRKYKARKK